MNKVNGVILRAGAVALSLLSGAANATVVADFNDFSSTAGLTLVGAAAQATTADGKVLRITPASAGQSGAFYSTSPITLGTNATFSSTFQFRFTSPGGIDPADGITFVLAKSASGLGGAGVGMGYSGVPNSVGIEFDTYNNAGYGLGNNDGNSSNHVSIDTNGNLNNAAITNVYGNGSCGFLGGSPSQNPYNADGCMSNGHLWSVSVGYDGTLLSVSLTDPGAGSAFNAITSYAIDIASILGTNQAYVGFTAASGAGWENHDIVGWHFANTTELSPGPRAQVPEPATLALLGLGLASLGFSRHKKKSA